MGRKLIALLIALIAILGLTSTALADGSLEHFQPSARYTPGRFSDVPENAWYVSGVQATCELGLMRGSGGAFSPDGAISRAEMLALACRVHSIYWTGGAEFIQSNP